MAAISTHRRPAFFSGTPCRVAFRISRSALAYGALRRVVSHEHSPSRERRTHAAQKVRLAHPILAAHERTWTDPPTCPQVYCVHTEPNFSLPWQRRRQYSSTSSGFIIEGRCAGA